MTRFFQYISTAFLVIICSCKEVPAEAQVPKVTKTVFDSEALLNRVKILSSDEFEGRRTGTKGAEKARQFIINEYKNLQVESFGEFQHEFTFTRRGDTIKGINVLAKVKGTKYPDDYIVVSAHYDHLGKRDGIIYNGADDDASGVSALIAFAEVLKESPPKHSVILAAFDAEELGLQGAKYFVDKMTNNNIVLNLNMDMISRSTKNELYVVGSRYTEFLGTTISNYKNPTGTKLLVGHDGTDGKQDWTYSSDHAPFYRAGIPFLYFGNEDHKGYHNPSDDFEEITPAFYKNAVSIIWSLFQDLDGIEL